MSESQGKTKYSGKPYVRVVPAGVIERDGKSYLKAVILYTPDTVDDLMEWPQRFLEIVESKSIPLKISLAFHGDPANKDAEVPKPDQYQAIPVLAKANYAQEAFKETKNEKVKLVQKLWKQSLGLTKKDDQWDDDQMKKLADRISAPLHGESTLIGQIKDGTSASYEYKKPSFGEHGQITDKNDPKKPNQIEAVLPVAHTSAAVALEKQRAEELCLSLKQVPGSENLKITTEIVRVGKLFDQLKDSKWLRQQINCEDIPCEPGSTHLLRSYEINENAPPAPWIGGFNVAATKGVSSIISIKNQITNIKTERHKNLYSKTCPERKESAKLFAGEVNKKKNSKCKENCISSAWNENVRDLRDAEVREGAFEIAADAHFFATWAQYETNQDKIDRQKGEAKSETSPNPDTLEKDETLEKAVRTFFSMQSTPTIARLFGLNIDVEISYEGRIREEIETAIKKEGFPKWGMSKIETAGMLFIAASIGDNQPWTLAKLRLKGSQSTYAPCYFLPATEEELFIGKQDGLQAEQLTQFDGHIVMSGGVSLDNGELSGLPRFDLSNINMRAAFELECQRRITRQEFALAKFRKQENSEAWEELAFGGKLDTAGLVLLDRGARFEAIRKLVSRHRKNNPDSRSLQEKPLILDAEDLTVGYRIDLGLPVSGKTEWRSFAYRKIDFGANGLDDNSKKTLKDLLKHLAGELEDPIRFKDNTEPRRLALDQAIQGTQSRLLPHGSKTEPTEDGVNKVEAIIEEQIALITGEPMVSLTREKDVSLSAQDVPPSVPDVFPFGREISLMTKDVKDKVSGTKCKRPFPLRYGQPIRICMPRIFAGGVSPWPGDIADVDSRLKGRVAYPPNIENLAQPYFRYLRHHAIAEPQVLLGHREALHVGLMGASHGPLMVVRTVISPNENNNKEFPLLAHQFPEKMRRIILPPSVEFTKAMSHGVFDGMNTPKGALRKLKCNGQLGGFPVTKSIFRRGINEALFLENRDVEDAEQAGTAGPEVQFGGPVAQFVDEGEGYFPDPAAEFFAYGLRRIGEDEYLPGIKEVEPLFLKPDNAKSPEVQVVEIVLNRENKRTSVVTQLTQNNIITSESGVEIQVEGESIDGKNGHRLTLNLAKGESYELDMWYVPSPLTLAREFALVQSLAVYVAKVKSEGRYINSSDSLGGLADILECSEKEEIREILSQELNKLEADKQSNDDWTKRYYATGFYVTPPTNVILAIANCLHQIMLRRPLREFAAVKTIRVVHAVERPEEKPKLDGISCRGPVSSPKRTGEIPDDTDNPLEIKRPSDQVMSSMQSNNSEKQAIKTEEGANNLILTGTLKLNPELSDGFELIMHTVLPGSSVFDDRNRRRSLSHRRSGTWPQHKTVGNDSKLESAYRTFGFEVKKDGSVWHPVQQATLLRVENLPLRSKKNLYNSKGCSGTIELDQFFTKESDKDDGWRVTAKHVFPDGKARLLLVTPHIMSRTAELMTTAQWFDGKEFHLPEPVPKEFSTTAGDPVQVILPATVRPAKCKVLKPFPVFCWEEKDDNFQKRVSRIRIPLGREWFSSGMFERVGIILYPDAPDLSPVSQYITCMGADPIRRASNNLETECSNKKCSNKPGVFLPHTAFEKDIDCNLVAKYESEVLLPAGETVQVAVGLVHYEPRFDPEQEHWYIDVDLNTDQLTEPFVRFGIVRYQPFTRPDLRVSRPVNCDAQPMPERTITTDLVEGKVAITVRGRASTGQKVIDPNKPTDHEKCFAKPQMRVRFFSEREIGSQVFREHMNKCINTGLTGTNDEMSEPKYVKAVETGNDDDDEMVWIFNVNVPPKEDGVGYVVYIEEIDWRRPAEYDDEPIFQDIITPNQTDIFVPSGPRSAARVDISKLLAK